MKNEWQMKELLRDYVGTIGVEKALEELPARLNLCELLRHCCAPTEAVLHIIKGDTCGRTMWFVRYDSIGGSGTAYFQSNDYSLRDAIASIMLMLIRIGVLNFDEYEKKLNGYNQR
jgi:hypothetical protein